MTNLFYTAPDALSLWFMAIIVIVFTAGAFYGADYLKAYRSHKRELRLHVANYVTVFASMLALPMISNALAFLVAWEIMALGSFFLIVFESWKPETIKAGINFFIQSHVSVVLLTIGFLMMYDKTGSFDFAAFKAYSSANPNACGWPFALICAGFAVKAGFVPFHTWLPVAHPAAPAHISGVMSGVIIKIGIYGIFRAITLFEINYTVAGKIILAVAAVSGLYGVMMAIVQHNLKKLLAYHSIENIGIIGMGIGLGCMAKGMGLQSVASLAFAGALLHTLNHALFKSSLFFTAGNVYQAAHTLNVEHLGGLFRRLPLTGLYFLIAAVAICGLPPMNGFVSELLIYMGLFGSLGNMPALSLLGITASIVALVLIGGLAILCFTKAFGIVFLGESRTELPEMKEFGALRSVPLAILAALMLSIGLCPGFYVGLVNGILPEFGCRAVALSGTVSTIGIASACLIVAVLVLALVRRLATRRRTVAEGGTWGCGYTVPSPKQQYTATSFVKTYSQTFNGILKSGFIDKAAAAYIRFTEKFAFLQNGRLQSYILYGIVFIVVTILLTLVLC